MPLLLYNGYINCQLTKGNKMTPNEIKRLQALQDKVEAHAGVSSRITLTEANVNLMRKAVLHNIRNGNNDVEMVNLAKKMGLI